MKPQISTKLRGIREKVKKELKYIPRGDIYQNELRMAYWLFRMHSLGKKAKVKETKEDVLKKSIEAVKRDYPDFIPTYDKNFFKL